jgi:hypothetical protein
MLNKKFLGGCHMFQCNATFFVIKTLAVAKCFTTTLFVVEMFGDR